MVNALSLLQAGCPNEGTPHPSVVQTSVLVRWVWVYTINIIRNNKSSMGEEGWKMECLQKSLNVDVERLQKPQLGNNIRYNISSFTKYMKRY